MDIIPERWCRWNDSGFVSRLAKEYPRIRTVKIGFSQMYNLCSLLPLISKISGRLLAVETSLNCPTSCNHLASCQLVSTAGQRLRPVANQLPTSTHAASAIYVGVTFRISIAISVLVAGTCMLANSSISDFGTSEIANWKEHVRSSSLST